MQTHSGKDALAKLLDAMRAEPCPINPARAAELAEQLWPDFKSAASHWMGTNTGLKPGRIA